MVRAVMRQGPGRLAAQDEGVEGIVGHGTPEPPLEGRADIADGMQLVLSQLCSKRSGIAVEQRARSAPLPSASNAASAASMPDFIAVWLPLILGTLRKPAVSPISAPPGKTSFGSDCSPPSESARAP